MRQHRRNVGSRERGAEPKKVYIGGLVVGQSSCFEVNDVSDRIAPLAHTVNFLCLPDQWHLAYVLWSGVCMSLAKPRCSYQSISHSSWVQDFLKLTEYE